MGLDLFKSVENLREFVLCLGVLALVDILLGLEELDSFRIGLDDEIKC